MNVIGYWLIIYLKKILIGKEKNTINVLIDFFIFHKSCVKIFLKWIVNQYLRALVSMQRKDWTSKNQNMNECFPDL